MHCHRVDQGAVPVIQALLDGLVPGLKRAHALLCVRVGVGEEAD